MGSAPQHPPHRPTLEDLLRFKRAERPAPEFWAEFDRGLRQKQLAALMKRPQGWARVRPVFVRSLRWAVPATAAAAVALVVIQVPVATTVQQSSAQVAGVSPVPMGSSVATAAANAQSILAAVNEAHMAALHFARQADANTEEPRSPATVVVATVEPDGQNLSWSEATLKPVVSATYHPSVDVAVSAPVSDTRRRGSSWTSRFNDLVEQISAERSSERILQLASYDLPIATQSLVTIGAQPAGRVVASNGYAAREPNERLLRELDSRFGVTGSSLSIKF